MPLNAPSVARELLHTRNVVCHGYKREDGLYDIEGHIVDLKSKPFTTDFRGLVPVDEPLHEMRLRLTVDTDMKVHAVEAVTDYAPFPAICPNIVGNYQRIVGLTIGKGWTRALKERLGGVEGCTHLLELLGPIATTAFQTINGNKAREMRDQHQREGTKMVNFPLLNSCHAFKSDSVVVRELAPDFYTGEKFNAEKAND
jgi:hypothetical protein